MPFFLQKYGWQSSPFGRLIAAEAKEEDQVEMIPKSFL